MRLTLKTPQTIESEEIRGLRGCLNDLMGLLTLPIVWRGREQDHVVATLLDAIRRVVELDFVYAHLSVPDGKLIEMIRIADSGNTNIDSDGLLLAIRRWLRNDTRTRSLRLAASAKAAISGSQRIASVPMSERAYSSQVRLDWVFLANPNDFF